MGTGMPSLLNRVVLNGGDDNGGGGDNGEDRGTLVLEVEDVAVSVAVVVMLGVESESERATEEGSSALSIASIWRAVRRSSSCVSWMYSFGGRGASGGGVVGIGYEFGMDRVIGVGDVGMPVGIIGRSVDGGGASIMLGYNDGEIIGDPIPAADRGAYVCDWHEHQSASNVGVIATNERDRTNLDLGPDPAPPERTSP